MAATLVVEDGTGLTAANSYLTVVEADSILCLNPIMYATWETISAGEQATYLIWASDYIDTYVNWHGYKAVDASGLRWPRECVIDVDGLLVDNDIVPDAVKQAVAQLAIFLICSAAAQSGGQSSNLPEGIKRLKADVVEIEFFEGGSADSQTGSDLLPVNLRFLIRGLGTVIAGRIRFAPLVR